MIAYSNDDLDRFLNVILVGSNLDKIRSMTLEYWKTDFEWRLDSSGIISSEVSYEEECDISKHAVECEDEDCLATLIKEESWLLSWKIVLSKHKMKDHISWRCAGWVFFERNALRRCIGDGIHGNWCFLCFYFL